jgi:hypothetical protein
MYAENSTTGSRSRGLSSTSDYVGVVSTDIDRKDPKKSRGMAGLIARNNAKAVKAPPLYTRETHHAFV